MASYLMVMQEIHVLVVDHDSEMATMLEACQYRVTRVELASIGIRLLLSGKTKYDMVMADVNSPDGQAINLLKEAVNKNIPIILMSVEDNPFVAMKTIENGAFLYVKKPVTIEMLKYLWQHITREKTPMISDRDRLVPNNPNTIGAFNMLMLKDNVESNRNIGERKGTNWEEELDSNKKMTITDNTKRKVSIEWTQELHNKFMHVVEQLGEGRCFPKDILELMNVPGLTKMQVASHLQRCRENKWQSAKKGQRRRLDIQPMLSNTNLPKDTRKKYGSMPQLNRTPSYHVTLQETIGAKTDIPNYGALEKMTTEPIETNASPREQYGSLAPFPKDAASGSSIPMNPSDDLFHFPELGSAMGSFFELSDGLAWIPNLDSSYGENHFDAVYHEQDPMLPSKDTMSNHKSR